LVFGVVIFLISKLIYRVMVVASECVLLSLL